MIWNCKATKRETLQIVSLCRIKYDKATPAKLWRTKLPLFPSCVIHPNRRGSNRERWKAFSRYWPMFVYALGKTLAKSDRIFTRPISDSIKWLFGPILERFCLLFGKEFRKEADYLFLMKLGNKDLHNGNWTMKRLREIMG